ncbi:hypothetical protein EON65_57995 [archaeon]|nr:MAG: hypothetical protein EON65_57995 [archaeon]
MNVRIATNEHKQTQYKGIRKNNCHFKGLTSDVRLLADAMRVGCLLQANLKEFWEIDSYLTLTMDDDEVIQQENGLAMEDEVESEIESEEIENEHELADRYAEPESASTNLTDKVEEPAAKKGRIVVKRPTSKWVLYLSEHRAECSKQHPDLSFAEITKVLAEGYKNITSEEAERLEAQLKDQKEQYEAYMAENREVVGQQQDTEPGVELIFPLARIKKLMKYDPDVKNVSKEATAAVTKCTEMFLARLALKAFAYTNMRSGK